MATTATQVFVARTLRRAMRKRCDPQSFCAQQARLLLDALKRQAAIPEPFPPLLWLHLFSSKQAYEWARGQWLRISAEDRVQILGEILDDSEYNLLSKHHCAVLALETVREAMRQCEHSSSGTLSYLVVLSTWPLPEQQQQQQGTAARLRIWLHVLELYLCTSPPYSTTVPPQFTQTLEWLLPRHMGHGVESLVAMHAQRSLFSKQTPL